MTPGQGQSQDAAEILRELTELTRQEGSAMRQNATGAMADILARKQACLAALGRLQAQPEGTGGAGRRAELGEAARELLRLNEANRVTARLRLEGINAALETADLLGVRSCYDSRGMRDEGSCGRVLRACF